MEPTALLKKLEAAERKQQRQAQRRQRELERQAKEAAKLSQQEQAALEVATYENRLEVLLSIHKEQGPVWDWFSAASALPPPCPQQLRQHELRFLQTALVAGQSTPDAAQQAQGSDKDAFLKATEDYEAKKAEHEVLKSLASRILARDHKAYIEALVEVSPLSELTDLGSLIHFTVHSSRLIQCDVTVAGTRIIPSETKSLTASGKVSTKAMPRGRFHEIYQDYVCGCVLRIAREVFALLPVEMVIVTASAELLNPQTGRADEQPVLSAALPRKIVNRLQFEELDPSDAMDNFQHRGDFKATRKEGSFRPITPLTPDDISEHLIEDLDSTTLAANIRKLKDELKKEMDELGTIKQMKGL